MGAPNAIQQTVGQEKKDQGDNTRIFSVLGRQGSRRTKKCGHTVSSYVQYRVIEMLICLAQPIISPTLPTDKGIGQISTIMASPRSMTGAIICKLLCIEMTERNRVCYSQMVC